MTDLTRLTEKERQALLGVCNDMEHREIAEVMRISLYMVRQYLCKAYAKLGVNSAGAACYLMGKHEDRPAQD